MTIISHDDIQANSRLNKPNSGAGISSLFTVLKRAVDYLKKANEQRIQHQIDRQAFSHLVALDEHTLADIGVSREDVMWASTLPIAVNASKELEKIAKYNQQR